MATQVVCIHGGEAYSSHERFLEHLRHVPIEPFSEPKKRWKDTLREDLGDAFEVFLPQMPAKDNAHYNEWKIWFERHFEFLKNDVILIGHSQGGYFLAKYLIENKTPFSVRSLYLVAAPIGPGSFGEDYDTEDGGDFVFDTTQLPNVQKTAEHIVIMHSKDDFVVPYEHALKYKQMLDEAELITFEDRGHFLEEKFPELIAQLREE